MISALDFIFTMSSHNDLLQCVGNNNFFYHYKQKLNPENVLPSLQTFSSAAFPLSSFFLAVLSFSVLLTVFKVIRQPPQRSNKLGHREQTVQRNPKDGAGSTPKNARCRRKDESIWVEAEAIERGR